MFSLALLTATGTYIIFWKLGILKLFHYKELRPATDGGLDALTTFGLVALFAGTFSGMMVGMISGLMVSGLLLVSRIFIRPKKTLRGKLHGIIHRSQR